MELLGLCDLTLDQAFMALEVPSVENTEPPQSERRLGKNIGVESLAIWRLEACRNRVELGGEL